MKVYGLDHINGKKYACKIVKETKCFYTFEILNYYSDGGSAIERTHKNTMYVSYMHVSFHIEEAEQEIVETPIIKTASLIACNEEMRPSRKIVEALAVAIDVNYVKDEIIFDFKDGSVLRTYENSSGERLFLSQDKRA